MKMCHGCKFNLENYNSGFETGSEKMLKLNCDNSDVFEQHFIRYTCLEMYVIHLMERIFYTNGYTLRELPSEEKD